MYEDDKIVCFHDLDPQAPVHVLIIPKKHIASLDDTTAEDEELLGYILGKVKEIAAELGYLAPQNFNRAFLNYWRCTPGEYRKAHRKLR